MVWIAQPCAGARRIREHQIYSLVVLVKVIVDDQDADGLNGVARVEREFAERDLIIAFLRSMIGLRLVESIEVDSRGTGRVAGANDADINMAAAFADDKRVGGELEQ